MIYLAISVWILLAIQLRWLYLQYKKYPSAKRLKVVDGMIHHPTFGVYPQKVKYTPGMTLRPGQSTEIILKISKDAPPVIVEDDKNESR